MNSLQLNHPPARIIKDLIVQLGHGTHWDAGGSWPVHYNQVPDAPDNCICVHDTDSILQGRDQIGGEVQERFGIQVLVRCSNPTTGYAKARAIAKSFDEDVYQAIVEVSQSTYSIHSISRTTGILNVGPEAGALRRYIRTLNATACIRLTDEDTGTAT